MEISCAGSEGIVSFGAWTHDFVHLGKGFLIGRRRTVVDKWLGVTGKGWVTTGDEVEGLLK
jgi:hypothetical protein